MNFYPLKRTLASYAALTFAALLMMVLLAHPNEVKAQIVHNGSISIQQAVALSLKNQPQLDQLQAQVKAAEARVGQAKSGSYPRVGIEGHVTHLDPVSSFALNPNEPAQNLEPQNSIDGHLAVQQLIYDFGKTKANIALARSQILTAKQRIQVKKWAISYFTVQTYNSILYLQDRIEVEEEQIKTLRQDLELAKKRLKNGSATKYDVLSTKVRIAEENNKKLDLIGQKEKTIIQLRKLFGWGPDRPVHLSGNLNLKRQTPAINPNQITYDARPDYQVLKQQEQQAQDKLKLDGTGNNPTISAGGTAGYKNGYIKDIDQPFANYSIGIQVNIPLFDGFKTHYKQQEARAQIQDVEAQKRELQRSINAQVRQAYVDVQTGLKKIKTADLHIKQAKQQLQLAKLRYRKGVITNTELLASETALARARLEKVTAQYHILLNQYQLKKAAGQKIWKSGL